MENLRPFLSLGDHACGNSMRRYEIINIIDNKLLEDNWSKQKKIEIKSWGDEEYNIVHLRYEHFIFGNLETIIYIEYADVNPVFCEKHIYFDQTYKYNVKKITLKIDLSKSYLLPTPHGWEKVHESIPGTYRNTRTRNHVPVEYNTHKNLSVYAYDYPVAELKNLLKRDNKYLVTNMIWEGNKLMKVTLYGRWIEEGITRTRISDYCKADSKYWKFEK